MRTRYYVRRASCGGSPCRGPSTETRSCNNRCCPVNCIWGGWSNWGSCSQMCAGGRQTRTRSIITQPACGGARCQGFHTESQSCNNHCCRINCKWGGWSNWGDCSQSCSGGSQMRTRSIAIQSNCKGRKCYGSFTDLQSCNTHCCRVDCKWGEWMTWKSCSQSCAGGSQMRVRYVDIQPQCSGTSCQGLAIEYQSCNTKCCPENCQWGRWAAFGTCSTTCGPGIQILRRKSIKESMCGGNCLGGKFNVISCNREMCSSKDGDAKLREIQSILKGKKAF